MMRLGSWNASVSVPECKLVPRRPAGSPGLLGLGAVCALFSACSVPVGDDLPITKISARDVDGGISGRVEIEAQGRYSGKLEPIRLVVEKFDALRFVIDVSALASGGKYIPGIDYLFPNSQVRDFILTAQVAVCPRGTYQVRALMNSVLQATTSVAVAGDCSR